MQWKPLSQNIQWRKDWRSTAIPHWMYWTSSCLVSETKQGPACLVSGWEKGLKKITESNLWLPLECTGVHAYTHTSTQVCACINTHTQNPISAPVKEAVSKSLCLEHRASRCLPSAQVLLTISASRGGYRERVRECSFCEQYLAHTLCCACCYH